jgi:glycosyltransferase involved in cell wall biosynthesis
VPFCYFPDAVGGTEIYVRELAREQRARGDTVLILAPADTRQSYLHEGMPVERYTVSNRIDDVRDLYGPGKTSIDEFMAVLAQFRPDVLHVHGIGRAIAPQALQRARQLGIGVVLTYHTPTATCVRGTLLLHGVHPCDGVLDAQRCTACTLTGHGLPAVVAELVARTPAVAGSVLRAARVRGRFATALRTRELVTLRHMQTRQLLAAADQVVAPAEWVLRLLQRLGLPPDKVTLSRQGIAYPAVSPRPAHREGTLALVYVGRVEPAKGVHLLLRALRALPDANITLHIYGVTQGDAHAQYRRDLRAEAARDQRVTLHEPVGPGDVVSTIAQYDVLVAPSQQLETGPLVVLEAFAAGLPVVGSRLGGIAELVQDGGNGLLVEAGSVVGWSAAFERLLHDQALLQRLQNGVQPPRTMAAVADDMAAVYHKVAA